MGELEKKSGARGWGSCIVKQSEGGIEKSSFVDVERINEGGPPRIMWRSDRIRRSTASSIQLPGDGQWHEEAKDVDNNVETGSINMEKYVKELSKVCWDMSRATGTMFEQEHLRFTNM